ncbi:hypothetical protein D4764_18G0001460 [Takifugu flavidus]|uniref:Uncharacterized protein n=1 Tax=Takifugu flavidus TaxID=433684 RepID=A0A5C6NTB2_9TELE|nr:hypothetical protein D4764_18G0001460 [Takifugu flavidus]
MTYSSLMRPEGPNNGGPDSEDSTELWEEMCRCIWTCDEGEGLRWRRGAETVKAFRGFSSEGKSFGFQKCHHEMNLDCANPVSGLQGLMRVYGAQNDSAYFFWMLLRFESHLPETEQTRMYEGGIGWRSNCSSFEVKNHNRHVRHQKLSKMATKHDCHTCVHLGDRY